MSVNATKLGLENENKESVFDFREENLSRDQTTLSSIVKLCEILKREEIDYCHWKSNAAIQRSASGANDLDLLVSRIDAERFIGILNRLGYKEVYVLPEEQLPGIRDFYSFDETTGQLIHVHAHFQLVLGHDLTKNYHLPIERSYLNSAVQQGIFRIPALEFELVVFVIRMVLKHSTLDAIIMRHGSLSQSERFELAYLLSPTTLEESRSILERHLSSIDFQFFKSCVQVLQPGCSFWKRIWIGQQLQNKLRSCARRPQIADLFLKLWRRVEQPIVYRLHLRRPRKRLANGGLCVAIIGGDGSGKTTAVTELRQRLSQDFDVIQVHMGKPSWSWTTILIRGVLKIGRSLGFYPFANEGSELSIDTDLPSFPGYPWLIRESLTARDRYLEYRRARRFASNGGLVICDRFPLPQIKIMDGPQVERVSDGIKNNFAIRALAALERRYYRRIMLPDLLMVLRVDPEVCVQRKTDEPSDSVRSRSREIWNIDWCKTPAHVIDASRSRSEVISDVLNLVWAHL